ncbi:MarR family winged helix-turn-helix transcriptional regulator [Radicibacter daui]|uniref:MarR family winged helix-turn-helix transcriptional regulator n=1 Tax=Radicibacter daui TaxID=3064829 RepID=UPI0040468A92
MTRPEEPGSGQAVDRAEFAWRQWQREKPELNSFPMAVLGRLNEASQVISQGRLVPLFARYGLQRGEFDVLATLRRSGAPYRLTPTALYEAAMISSGGMTSRLDRMEKAGLVRREPHPDDRRAFLVALTEKGHALLDEVLPAHVENERTILAALSPDEQEQLYRLMGKLLGGLA